MHVSLDGEISSRGDLWGFDKQCEELFSYVELEARVRREHALRRIREVVNVTLADLSGGLAAPYSGLGRPSIAPEMLLRAMLLQAFYSVRSKRQSMERLEFDLLFRWFAGPGGGRSGMGPLDILRGLRSAACR